MAEIKPLPPTSYLHECLDYEPLTGRLRWRYRPAEHFPSSAEYKRWNARYAFQTAGSVETEGYVVIRLAGLKLKAHRVIWKMMTGEDPPDEVDHKDTVRDHNAWDNLRLLVKAKQKWNSRLHRNNTTGHKGIQLRKGKYQVKVGGKWFGTYAKLELAIAARDIAAHDMAGALYRREDVDG